MIRRVCWKQDSSLSGLKLDFTKPDGGTYNTIVFVGENGAGKTRILDSLSDFLNCKDSFDFDSFEYEIDGEKYCLKPNPSDSYSYQHDRYRNGEKQKTSFYWINHSYTKLMEDSKDIRSHGCAYSKARTGFKSDPIDKTTNKTLDEEKHMPDDNYDYTEVKQTLIDVADQDNAEWMEICETQSNPDFDEFRRNSRMYRFRNAFDSFFDSLRFHKVKLLDGKKRVLFDKDGREVDIDDLSTGEKQIVFRGSYLLRNSHNIKDGIVLIDEPELSMHPKWQSRILKFYRNLFTYDEVQTTQIFIATHSEFVLKEALRDTDNVKVVLLQVKDGCTVVGPIEDRVLPGIESSEIDYLIFGMYTYEYHIRLFGYYQELIGSSLICDVDRKIHDNELYDDGKDRSGRDGKMESLPVYVRNFIDHPEEKSRSVDDALLKESTDLLRKFIQNFQNSRMPENQSE